MCVRGGRGKVGVIVCLNVYVWGGVGGGGEVGWCDCVCVRVCVDGGERAVAALAYVTACVCMYVCERACVSTCLWALSF